MSDIKQSDKVKNGIIGVFKAIITQGCSTEFWDVDYIEIPEQTKKILQHYDIEIEEYTRIKVEKDIHNMVQKEIAKLLDNISEQMHDDLKMSDLDREFKEYKKELLDEA